MFHYLSNIYKKLFYLCVCVLLLFQYIFNISIFEIVQTTQAASIGNCLGSFECNTFVYAGPITATTISGNYIPNANVEVVIIGGPGGTYPTITDTSGDWTIGPFDLSAYPGVTLSLAVSISEPGTCPNGAIPQIFNGKMIGCADTITYPNRASICPVGTHTCTATEYTTNRNAVVPTHHYWTDSQLRYNGSSNACFVSETVGNFCGANTPMRVCMPGNLDPLGNRCNRNSCGIDTVTPNEYFGGCAGNNEAGTVCCGDGGSDISLSACTETETCSYTISNVCGDGIQSGIEQCDDGNTIDTDTCTNACAFAVCGDSIMGPGEQCDDGNTIDTDACTNACTILACGDGILSPGEECDDGNTTAGDYCSTSCEIEYCRNDAPITDTSRNFDITSLSPSEISGTSTQANSKVAICFEDSTGSRDIVYTSTDAAGGFIYIPALTTYTPNRINIGVMLHDQNNIDIDHHALVIGH